ncbi:MAG: GGDEF domain-containing protein [Bacteroidetes bacterium]|nr:GGDEF domain-containing protein [Bacteroidota bacterium]
MDISNQIIHLFLLGFLGVVIFVLIIKLKHYYDLSQIDELTSIKNYRGFQRMIRKATAKNKKNGKEFSFAIFDIDEFRNYNLESYAFGDCVLKEFVKFIKSELPEDACVARFKFGDEFIVMLHSDLISATEKINFVQKKCRENSFLDSKNQRNFRISFSYGTALFDKNTDTIESLLDRTEKALKESKKNLVKSN